MGDLFLHLGFARRLRFADGLHPVVVETMVRQPAPLVVTSTLPLLPGIEQKGASLLRRLLGRGKTTSARWSRQLSSMDEPRGDLPAALLARRSGGPGQMTRLALALGAISHAVLEASVGDITRGLDGAERQAVERGQARLWLQFAVPSLRDLEREWAPTAELDDAERVRRPLEHLEAALASVHGEAPGTDALSRWVRALAAEMIPLVDRAALPPEGALPEHEVRSRYFEGDAAFLEKAQRAIHWFVYLANELGALCLGREATDEELRAAVCDEFGALRPVPEDFDVERSRAAWQERVRALRQDHLDRGHNPKPAYYESQEIASMVPELPPLPDDASEPVAVPAHTQEISAADIESELEEAAGGPAPLQAPAMTQEISAADIESEIEEAAPAPGASVPAAPTTTQQISAADIEAELPAAPTTTQQISAADIEAELTAAPTTTQQISAADIEAELSASDGAPEEASAAETAPASDAAFPSPPRTPPMGTLSPDASQAPATPTPRPAEEGRTKTPPLGTPAAQISDGANGATHDGATHDGAAHDGAADSHDDSDAPAGEDKASETNP